MIAKSVDRAIGAAKKTGSLATAIDRTDGTQITGTANPGSTIEVDIDGDGKPNFVATADLNTGAWRITPNPALVDGQVFKVTATDADGNTSLGTTAVVEELTMRINHTVT